MLMLWGVVWSVALAQEPAVAERSAPLEIAAAWEDSSYFAWATELAGRVQSPRLLVQPSAGSADNLGELASGRVSLALAQSDAAWHAWAGSGRLAADDQLVTLGRAHVEVVHLVVPEGSEITDVAGLEGHRVDVGHVGSGSLFNSLDLLAAAGVNPTLDFGGQLLFERLAMGKIDAALFTTRAPAAALADKRVRVLGLGSVAEQLAVAPYYDVVALDPSYGSGQTVAVGALVVAHRDLPEAVVTALLDAAKLSPESLTIPLHPAARAWFDAHGQPVPEVTPTRDFTPPLLPALPPPTQIEGDEIPVHYLSVDDVVREMVAINPILEGARLAARQKTLSLKGLWTAYVPWMKASGGLAGPESGANETLSVGVTVPTGTTVSASVGATSSALDDSATWGSVAQLGLTQQLLDGLMFDQTLAGIRRAQIDALSAQAGTELSALGLVTSVQKKFYDLSESHARLRLKKRQVVLSERHRNRVALGKAGPEGLATQEAADALAKAEVALLAEERVLRDIEDSLLDDVDAKFRFRILPVGDLEAEAMQQAGSEGALDARIATAVQRRPELIQRGLSVQRARIDLAEARRSRLPGLAVKGAVGKASDGSDTSMVSATGAAFGGENFWSAGADLSFRLGREAAYHSSARLKLAVEQRELESNDAVENVTREVRTAWRAMDNARKRLEVAQRSRSLSDRKLSLTIAAFRTGDADSFKVLRYQDDYLAAELRVLGAATDYLQAVAELDRVSGVGADPYLDLPPTDDGTASAGGTP